MIHTGHPHLPHLATAAHERSAHAAAAASTTARAADRSSDNDLVIIGEYGLSVDDPLTVMRAFISRRLKMVIAEDDLADGVESEQFPELKTGPLPRLRFLLKLRDELEKIFPGRERFDVELGAHSQFYKNEGCDARGRPGFIVDKSFLSSVEEGKELLAKLGEHEAEHKQETDESTANRRYARIADKIAKMVREAEAEGREVDLVGNGSLSFFEYLLQNRPYIAKKVNVYIMAGTIIYDRDSSAEAGKSSASEAVPQKLEHNFSLNPKAGHLVLSNLNMFKSASISTSDVCQGILAEASALKLDKDDPVFSLLNKMGNYLGACAQQAIEALNKYYRYPRAIMADIIALAMSDPAISKKTKDFPPLLNTAKVVIETVRPDGRMYVRPATDKDTNTVVTVVGAKEKGELLKNEMMNMLAASSALPQLHKDLLNNLKLNTVVCVDIDKTLRIPTRTAEGRAQGAHELNKDLALLMQHAYTSGIPINLVTYREQASLLLAEGPDAIFDGIDPSLTTISHILNSLETQYGIPRDYITVRMRWAEFGATLIPYADTFLLKRPRHNTCLEEDQAAFMGMLWSTNAAAMPAAELRKAISALLAEDKKAMAKLWGIKEIDDETHRSTISHFAKILEAISNEEIQEILNNAHCKDIAIKILRLLKAKKIPLNEQESEKLKKIIIKSGKKVLSQVTRKRGLEAGTSFEEPAYLQNIREHHKHIADDHDRTNQNKIQSLKILMQARIEVLTQMRKEGKLTDEQIEYLWTRPLIAMMLDDDLGHVITTLRDMAFTRDPANIEVLHYNTEDPGDEWLNKLRAMVGAPFLEQYFKLHNGFEELLRTYANTDAMARADLAIGSGMCYMLERLYSKRMTEDERENVVTNFLRFLNSPQFSSYAHSAPAAATHLINTAEKLKLLPEEKFIVCSTDPGEDTDDTFAIFEKVKWFMEFMKPQGYKLVFVTANEEHEKRFKFLIRTLIEECGLEEELGRSILVYHGVPTTRKDSEPPCFNADPYLPTRASDNHVASRLIDEFADNNIAELRAKLLTATEINFLSIGNLANLKYLLTGSSSPEVTALDPLGKRLCQITQHAVAMAGNVESAEYNWRQSLADSLLVAKLLGDKLKFVMGNLTDKLPKIMLDDLKKASTWTNQYFWAPIVKCLTPLMSDTIAHMLNKFRVFKGYPNVFLHDLLATLLFQDCFKQEDERKLFPVSETKEVHKNLIGIARDSRERLGKMVFEEAKAEPGTASSAEMATAAFEPAAAAASAPAAVAAVAPSPAATGMMHLNIPLTTIEISPRFHQRMGEIVMNAFGATLKYIKEKRDASHNLTLRSSHKRGRASQDAPYLPMASSIARSRGYGLAPARQEGDAPAGEVRREHSAAGPAEYRQP